MRMTANKFLSSANFQQAWLQVNKNKGCTGIDGETLTQFKQNLDLNLSNLRKLVASGNYQLQIRRYKHSLLHSTPYQSFLRST